MYRGFQVKLHESAEIFDGEFEDYLSSGREMFEEHQTEVQTILDDFLLSDGSIDGSKMQENWFPQIKADVFISHSHKDEDLAIALAGWLYEKFELVSFIDSCVWGYSEDLRQMLLRTYRRHSGVKANYSLSNFASSHVHMMLSVALNQMIDNTECLFFLNTPNSIPLDAPIDGTTTSPWIYSEIAISRLIRKKCPRKLKRLCESSLRYFSANQIRYRLPMDHLSDINSADLSKWMFQKTRLSSIHPLDSLYKLIDKI